MAEQDKSDKTLVNLRIDKDLAERGKALAKRRGGNLSTLLRGMLIAALEEDEAKEAAKAKE
jgi:antitoxin component of RelBE/YafQ-DinJ toxin-antitoxin module